MNYFLKTMFVFMWAVPFCIAFVLSLLWQGWVIGWNGANKLLDDIE